MLARIVLDENKGILFCIKILSSYNRHLKNTHKSSQSEKVHEIFI